MWASLKKKQARTNPTGRFRTKNHSNEGQEKGLLERQIDFSSIREAQVRRHYNGRGIESKPKRKGSRTKVKAQATWVRAEAGETARTAGELPVREKAQQPQVLFHGLCVHYGRPGFLFDGGQEVLHFPDAFRDKPLGFRGVSQDQLGITDDFSVRFDE
jgi:hypothetical protein